MASTEKLFSFRWDIDHRACITDGLPRIMQVCDGSASKIPFFVNMGRATNLKEWLMKGGIKGSKAKLKDMEAVHLIKKIGWPRFILETLLSRPVGRSLSIDYKNWSRPATNSANMAARIIWCGVAGFSNYPRP